MKLKKIFLLLCFIISINNVYAKEKVELSKCVDGDTFKVIIKNKEYTVRMLAIDTPESVHPKKPVEYYGKEASNYTCEKLTNATNIELEYDKNSDKLDKYDRLLAWVYVDDILLQVELIKGGYAKIAYLYGDYLYVDKLKEAQVIASEKNIGVWNTEEAEKFNSKNQEEEEYSYIDIIIIFVLLLIVAFVGDKKIKSKAKKKLNKYLN